MGRIYTVGFNAVAVTAQQDLISLVAGADKPIRIHEIFLSQSTEIGDAQEEGLNITWRSGNTTVGSGGTAPTPVPRDVDDTATGATARIQDTTPASAGTPVTHYGWNWNVRVPFQVIFPPEYRPYLKGQRRGCLGLLTTPADSITMSGYITYEEGPF